MLNPEALKMFGWLIWPSDRVSNIERKLQKLDAAGGTSPSQLVDMAFKMCNDREQGPKRRCKKTSNCLYGANVQSVEEGLALSPKSCANGHQSWQSKQNMPKEGHRMKQRRIFSNWVASVIAAKGLFSTFMGKPLRLKYISVADRKYSEERELQLICLYSYCTVSSIEQDTLIMACSINTWANEWMNECMNGP